MIALKPWKIGISRRVRQPVYFGLSYVKGWLDPNWLLNGWAAGYVYAPYVMASPLPIALKVVEIKPMAEPESVFFSGNILGNVE